MSQPWDYIAKLVCIGDSGTGKSSLTIRLCEGRFSSAHDVTIGVEFGSRTVPVGPPAQPLPSSSSDQLLTEPSTSPPQSPPKNPSKRTPNIITPSPMQKHMKLSLWDTAGQEVYKSITRSYFRGASGALLVYDITRPATFEHVRDWLSDLRQIAGPDIVVVLVGNKLDLVESDASKRAVSTQEAERWCTENGILRHVETSAKSGQGVEDAFVEVATKIWHNIEAGRYDLNDRRSGVKGPGAGGAGLGKGGRRERTVTLGMNDVAGGNKGWSGGCC